METIIGLFFFVIFVVGFFRIESTVLKTHEAVKRIEQQLANNGTEKEKK